MSKESIEALLLVEQVHKLIVQAAVLAERARCAAICRDSPWQEGQWLANSIEGIEDED